MVHLALVDKGENATEVNLAAPDIEIGLAATVIFSPDLFDRVDGLVPEDFTVPAIARLWREMAEIKREGGSFDGAILTERLRKEWPAAAKYVASLHRHVAIRDQVPHYAADIRDRSHRRKILALTDAASKKLGETDNPPDEVISRLIGDLQDVAANGTRGGKGKHEIANEIRAGLDHPLPSYPTRIEGLDLALGGGIFAGKLYGIAARKKVGKTLLLGTISQNLNSIGIKHLFITLEMSPHEIEQRNIARIKKFNAIRFLKRDDPLLADRVSDYIKDIGDRTIYEAQPGASLDDVRSMISRAIVNRQIKGAIIDYWQLVDGKDGRETEEYHLRKVAQTLANIARNEGIFVLTAAQVNQDGNTRGGEGLKLACDQYYTLHREKSSEHAWLEMEESRYTLYQNVGSEDLPGVVLSKHGPHFQDAGYCPENS